MPPGALMVRHLRFLLVGVAVFQTLTLFGVWRLVASDAELSLWISGTIATLIALGCAVASLIRLLQPKPVNRAEILTGAALAFNPLWPGVPIITESLIRDPSSPEVSYTFIAAICMLFFHAFPGAILFVSLHRRLGSDDEHWSPTQTESGPRSVGLMGMSILIGGWTAAYGLLAFFAVQAILYAPTIEEIVLGLGSLNFALAAGMALGFLSSLFSATLPSNTHLDRAIPWLFAPPFVAGVVASAINPMAGALAAGAAIIVSSFTVSGRFKLIPIGLCQSCAYDISGIDSDTCPECGHHYTAKEPPAVPKATGS